MPIVAALILGAAVVAYATAKLQPKVALFRGVERRVVFKDGSTAEHASRLRTLFDNVVDEGNGSYRVTPVSDGLFTVPEGARIV